MGFNSGFKGLTPLTQTYLMSVNICQNILVHVPFIFLYFVLLSTNAQLFHKLSHSYMFRHYRVILREFVVNIFARLHEHLRNAIVGKLQIVLPTAAFEILV